MSINDVKSSLRTIEIFPNVFLLALITFYLLLLFFLYGF